MMEKTAKAFLKAYTEAVMETMTEGDSVQLIGFGKFEVRHDRRFFNSDNHRKARKGRNPKTGAALNIPAKTVPAFRPGAKMQKATR